MSELGGYLRVSKIASYRTRPCESFVSLLFSALDFGPEARAFTCAVVLRAGCVDACTRADVRTVGNVGGADVVVLAGADVIAITDAGS